jgi:hypothetical protein
MDNIEIHISTLDDNALERVVYLNGKEMFYDRRDIHVSPDNNDPVRSLQFFLWGKELQCTCLGRRYTRNHFNPPDRRRINVFGKFKQFVVQLLKVRA